MTRNYNISHERKPKDGDYDYENVILALSYRLPEQSR